MSNKDNNFFVAGSLSTKIARTEAEIRCAKQVKKRNENIIGAVGFVVILFTTMANLLWLWLSHYNSSTVLVVLNIAAVVGTVTIYLISSHKSNKKIRKALKKRNYYVTEYMKVA